MTKETLSAAPGLARLYARALVTAVGPRSSELPERELLLEDVAVDRGHLAAFNRVCGFRLGDRLPPTYPHVLVFPLQMQLMTDRSFPFALPGLVHVHNAISQLRPVSAEELLTLRVHAERLAAHVRGAQVDLVASADVDGEPVWQSRSTYLSRGASLPGATQAADVTMPDEPQRTTAVWRLPSDLGRRYAAVSGDLNPIHLNPLAARALGFARTIVHGMWANARCLADLEGRLPDGFDVEVAFRKPVLLPSTVQLATRPTNEGWNLALHSRNTRTTHLVAALRPR